MRSGKHTREGPTPLRPFAFGIFGNFALSAPLGAESRPAAAGRPPSAAAGRPPRPRCRRVNAAPPPPPNPRPAPAGKTAPTSPRSANPASRKAHRAANRAAQIIAPAHVLDLGGAVAVAVGCYAAPPERRRDSRPLSLRRRLWRQARLAARRCAPRSWRGLQRRSVFVGDFAADKNAGRRLGGLVAPLRGAPSAPTPRRPRSAFPPTLFFLRLWRKKKRTLRGAMSGRSFPLARGGG